MIMNNCMLTANSSTLRLLYCFVRGTLSPSFTPCKGDNIPLDPRNAACGGFYYFKKVNAVAVTPNLLRLDFDIEI